MSSVGGRENEAFTKEEDTNESRTQACQNTAEENESSGRFGDTISTRCDRGSKTQENDAKNIGKLSNLDGNNSTQVTNYCLHRKMVCEKDEGAVSFPAKLMRTF